MHFFTCLFDDGQMGKLAGELPYVLWSEVRSVGRGSRGERSCHRALCIPVMGVGIKERPRAANFVNTGMSSGMVCITRLPWKNRAVFIRLVLGIGLGKGLSEEESH
jgi:hypothetical protein